MGIICVIFGYSFLKSTSLFDDNITLYAVYNDVGGLQSGTAVSINGKSVGTVNSVKFKDASGQLLVTFSVSRDLIFSKKSTVYYSLSANYIGIALHLYHLLTKFDLYVRDE